MHPLRDTVPTAAYSGKHSWLANSTHRQNWRSSILGDTTSKTRSAFQSLRQTIQRQKQLRKPDSAAMYQLLFEEVRSWRDDLWGNSYSTFRITQTDSTVQVKQLIAKLQGPPHFAISASWYAYANNYLIVRVCKSHFGENSWGTMWTYYLKKKR